MRVISHTFDLYLGQAPVLLPATAAVFLVVGAVTILLREGPPLISLLSFPIEVAGTALVTGMAVALVADTENIRPEANVGRLLKELRPVLSQLILVGFIVGIAEAAGLALLIVPGLALLTIWAVYAPVVVIERPVGLVTLSRSRELVRGNGWRVFAVILILVVLVDVIAGVVALVDHSANPIVVLIIEVIISSIAIPLSALGAAVLYFDLCAAPNHRAGKTNGRDDQWAGFSTNVEEAGEQGRPDLIDPGY